MRRLLAGLLISSAILLLPSHVQAAKNSSTYKGGGYTLTLSGRNTAMGQVLTGTLAFKGKTYQVQGDWIPAADQGTDLLRVYGKVMAGQMGLMSVAVLENTCKPNCAAGKTYKLGAISQWKLPGGQGSVLLTLQG